MPLSLEKQSESVCQRNQDTLDFLERPKCCYFLWFCMWYLKEIDCKCSHGLCVHNEEWDTFNDIYFRLMEGTKSQAASKRVFPQHDPEHSLRTVWLFPPSTGTAPGNQVSTYKQQTDMATCLCRQDENSDINIEISSKQGQMESEFWFGSLKERSSAEKGPFAKARCS